ncbi:hypothetical protein TURU_058936 [Turdus rufiventris]|nr:hypothetical protein TURU_058936 [Turdus rufiventris]
MEEGISMPVWGRWSTSRPNSGELLLLLWVAELNLFSLQQNKRPQHNAEMSLMLLLKQGLQHTDVLEMENSSPEDNTRVTGHQSFGLSPVNLYWQSPTNPISSQADAKLFQPTLTIRKKLSTRSP